MKRFNFAIISLCIIILLAEFSKKGQYQFDFPFLREAVSMVTQSRPATKRIIVSSLEYLEDRNFGLSKDEIKRRDSKNTVRNCQLLKFSELDAKTVLVNIKSYDRNSIEKILGVSECFENDYVIYKSKEFEIRVKYIGNSVNDYEPKLKGATTI